MSASAPVAVAERNYEVPAVVSVVALSVSGAERPVGRGHGRHAVVPEEWSMRKSDVEWPAGRDRGLVVVPVGLDLRVSGAQSPAKRDRGGPAVVPDGQDLRESGGPSAAGVTTEGPHRDPEVRRE